MSRNSKLARLTASLLMLGASALVGSTDASAQEVWTGLDLSFTKANGADPALPANQDRITGDVWITRANSKGIFNIAQESGYSPPGCVGALSPADTEWAYGSAADWAILTFVPWETLHACEPPILIGEDVVVHLISDDIYLDLRFESWSGGGSGGGFSYLRAIPEPARDTLLAAGLLGLAGLSRIRRRSETPGR